MDPPPARALLLLLLLTALVAPASAIPSALAAAPASLRATLASYGHPLARAGGVAAKTPGVYGTACSPLDYGADPLGLRDSAPAFAACVEFCVNYSTVIDHLGHFPGDDSFPDGKYIANAGGCTIDLGGGSYLLSSPVKIPQFIANVNVREWEGKRVGERRRAGGFGAGDWLDRIEPGIPPTTAR